MYNSAQNVVNIKLGDHHYEALRHQEIVVIDVPSGRFSCVLGFEHCVGGHKGVFGLCVGDVGWIDGCGSW